MMLLGAASYSQIIISLSCLIFRVFLRDATALIMPKLVRDLIEMPGMNEIWGRKEYGGSKICGNI
jgi:hypothetical protein